MSNKITFNTFTIDWKWIRTFQSTKPFLLFTIRLHAIPLQSIEKISFSMADHCNNYIVLKDDFSIEDFQLKCLSSTLRQMRIWQIENLTNTNQSRGRVVHFALVIGIAYCLPK